MIRLCLVVVASLTVFAGCAQTKNSVPTDAHLVIGLQVTPKMRQGTIGMLTPNIRATVALLRLPLRRNIPAQRLSVSANDGWEYIVIPVVSGIYSLSSVTIQGGGVMGREITRLSNASSISDDYSSRVQGATFFDVPKGSVAYIGSFDIEASYSPVEIELLENLAKAKGAAQKAGLDPAVVKVIKRNVFRGMKDINAFRGWGNMTPDTKSGG